MGNNAQKPPICRDAVIVSYTFTGGNPLVLVGRKVNGKVEVVNSFSGEEAAELYTKLTTPSPVMTKEGE